MTIKNIYPNVFDKISNLILNCLSSYLNIGCLIVLPDQIDNSLLRKLVNFVGENAIKIDVFIKCEVCMYILQKEAVKPLIWP